MINTGPSVDTATINENVGSFVFVEDADAQDFAERSHPRVVVEVSNQMSKEDELKEIQSYFANPDSNLKTLLGELKYAGKIDGKLSDEFINLIDKFEYKVSEIIDINLNKLTIKTSLRDIKAAVNKLSAYKNLLEHEGNNMRMDDRFVFLTKIINKN